MSTVLLLIIIMATLTFMLSLVGQIAPLKASGLKKATPYECGFDPMNSPRLPFSFRFFLVAILFLMFDLEMALLLPAPLGAMQSLKKSIITMKIFMLILTLGLYFEWTNGGLEWATNK